MSAVRWIGRALLDVLDVIVDCVDWFFDSGVYLAIAGTLFVTAAAGWW